MNIKRLYELSEIVDKILQGDDVSTDINSLTNEIRNIIQPWKQGSIGIAQLNPIVGDIEYNSLKIMKYISYATEIGLDIIIFPELSIMGYPIEDTIDRHPVIVDENVKWLKEIAKLTTTTTAVVGFVEPRVYKNKTGKKYYNSLAILNNGSIQGIIRKSLLPNYSEFNDYRYIEPSPVVGNQPPSTLGVLDEDNVQNVPKTNIINGIKYGLSICEDCWNNKSF